MKRLFVLASSLLLVSCSHDLTRAKAADLIRNSAFIKTPIRWTFDFGSGVCESPDFRPGSVSELDFVKQRHPDLEILRERDLIAVHVFELSRQVDESIAVGHTDPAYMEAVKICMNSVVKAMRERAGAGFGTEMNLAFRSYWMYQITPTQKGSDFLDLPHRHGGTLAIPIVEKEFVAVTGLAKNADQTVAADFQFKYVPTKQGTESGLATQYAAGPQNQKAHFKLYDDGWRLE